VSTVLALIGENCAAVDARPLVNFGLLDFVPLSTADDPAPPTGSASLFNWLGDEQIYGDIVRSLSRQADLVASRLAADLEEDPALIREALDMAMGSWHLALWRLANRPIVLARNEATSTILAPVQPNRYFQALG
jgi:hypothetical protein